MKFVVKYSNGDLFVECNGRSEIKTLKRNLYEKYKDTVFKTNKYVNLRAKMFSSGLNDEDTVSDLILRENSELINDMKYPDCYVLYLGMTSKPPPKCTMC